MPTPYAAALEGHDPVDVLRQSLDDYRGLAPRLTAAFWERPWQPGKWTLRQIVLHVAQFEMIFGVRVRAALSIEGYTVQPAEQDPLMAIEGGVVDGPTAFAAFEGMRRMNLALVSSLSPVQRRRAVDHPERGRIDVEDLIVTLAGHPVHHLKQLQSVVDSSAAPGVR